MQLDYSFLHVGGLYQAIINATLEASRRFGADKAMNVILTAMYMDRDASKLQILDEIRCEAGIEVSDEDLEFLGGLIVANSLVGEAIKALEVVCKK